MNEFSPVPAIVEPVQDQRARNVKAELESLQSKTEDNIFDVCDLLMEAKDNEYNKTFGFASFLDWVEFTPSFDLTKQTARYYLNIAQKALRLNVDRPTMKRIKMSKLREIFSLDPDTHRKEMEDLLAEAEALTIDQVKSKVRAIKAGAGVEELVFLTLKYPISAKQNVEDAFERIRQQNGNYKIDGEVVEMTNGLAFTRICEEFLAGPVEEVPEELEDSFEVVEETV